MMKSSFTALTCGLNGAGISSMISVERNLPSQLEDTEPMVISRALINVGDSTQRFCLEKKIKLSAISLIVITSLAPHCLSGLPGLIHALSSLGLGKLTLIGPEGIESYMNCITPFVNRKYPEVNIIQIKREHSVSNPCTYSNDRFYGSWFSCSPSSQSSVVAIGGFITATKTSSIPVGIFSYCDHFRLSPSSADMEAFVAKSTSATSYVRAYYPVTVTDGLNDRQYDDMESGHELAIYFKIRLSSQHVELSSAQEDKAVFHKLYLQFYTEPFMHVYDPPTAYVEPSTLHRRAALPLMSIDLTSSHHTCIYQHTCSWSYQDANGISTNLYRRISDRLACLSVDPNIASNTCTSGTHTSQKATASATTLALPPISSPTPPSSVLTDEVKDSITSTANSTAANSIRDKLLKRKRSDVHMDSTATQQLQTSSPNPIDDVHVIFLGTGCASPSKHRNNSCILLQHLDISILLDAGEGISAQLYQHCSGDMSRFYTALLSIRLIWISHQHCDHIAGYPMLLQHIHRARIHHRQHHHTNTSTSYPNISIICPSNVRQYYDFIACVSGMDDMVTIIPIIESAYAGMTSRIQSITNNAIKQLQSVPVYHCHEAYGIILTLSNNLKIVYSGDCRPNASLIASGRGCDLLIHEATFDASMSDDAMKKKHCTIAEALAVSHSMNAKYTILTHFSQRYPTSTSINASTSSPLPSTCALAFDFMHFQYPHQIASLVTSCQTIILPSTISAESIEEHEKG